ncbi:MAG: exodeoxyribonuclease VII small subunit [Candidatus Omnitrophica bacterium]|nr:exodeoxyribonuclease VII small subunit [Candidatus Omnitrophota bacterium]
MKETSFEKALENLERTVDELEAGELSLDDSLKKYEEGVKLARMCQEKLEKAKKRIEKLVKDDGKFSTEPLDEE